MIDFDLQSFMAAQRKRVRLRCQQLETRLLKRRKDRQAEALDAIDHADKIAKMVYGSRRLPDMDTQAFARHR